MKIISLFVLLLCSQAFAKLPPLKAKSLSGETIVHQWQDTKLVSVVIFLSAECPCSDSHIPHLKELPTQYPDVKFFALHANYDEETKEVSAYFQKAALPFPILDDSSQEWANILKARRTPHAFVISKEGEILFQGGVSSSSTCANADTLFLKEALNDIGQKKKVRTPQSRVLGCEISRK